MSASESIVAFYSSETPILLVFLPLTTLMLLAWVSLIKMISASRIVRRKSLFLILFDSVRCQTCLVLIPHGLALIAIQLGASRAIAFDDYGREIRPRSWRQDATINDVCFVNATHGWAVGDQGLILRTVNGGEDWTECEGAGLDLDDHRSFEQKLVQMRPISRAHELYPLTCSLNCVYFLDRNKGWIAGSYYTAYLRRTHSVLLRTDDGGQTWSIQKTSFLPQINRIHFQDVLGGWALGRAGSLYKTGVLTTSSGGQTWSSQSIEPAGSWIDGDLVSSGFVVIDDHGALGKITGNQFEPAVVIGRRPGRMDSVRMANAKTGWAVGSAGTVLMTRDGGSSWSCPAPIASSTALNHFDFATVSIQANRVWIAGNPGTMILSMDAATGEDLQVHATPVSLPIRKIQFIDGQNGWAVGANGMVLATTDQGRNWEVQRLAQDRIGMLVASPGTQQLPFALLANIASEEGVLSGSVIVKQEDPLSLLIASAATTRIGCSMNQELRGDNRDREESDMDSDQTLKELVRTIRTVRPNALVCNCPIGSGHGELASQFIATCRSAIELAANDDSFSDQLEEARLQSWQVDRFLIRTAAGSGQLNLDGSRYLSRSGQLVEDQIAISRGLSGLSPVFGGPESYKVESFNGSVGAIGGDIFYGLQQLGREVPRRDGNERWGSFSSIATAPLKHREMDRLLGSPLDSPEQKAALRKQIQSFGTGLEAPELGTCLTQLAERFLQAGNLEMAAWSLEQMIHRVGDHAFTPAALMWLTQYSSSSEIAASIAAEFESQQAGIQDSEADGDEATPDATPAIAQTIPTAIVEDGVQKITWKPVLPNHDSAKEANVGNTDSVDDPIEIAKSTRTATASQFLNRLKQRDPDLAQSEPIQFMEATLVQKIPGDFSSENMLKRLRRTADTNSEFGLAAGRELHLRDPRFEIPAITCFAADSRPHLDGDLSDDLWQTALEHGNALFRTMKTVGENPETWTDVVWLAHDSEFLYLAARCNKIPGMTYGPIETERDRDPDLEKVERVQLTLDFDRDFQSNFIFEIDPRGRVSESCGGSNGWNPDWFVAAAQNGQAWTIECAIPLNELTSDELGASTWIAIELGRLDQNSIDLWSGEVNREPRTRDIGILAGLKIRPQRYEFMRFAFPDNADAEKSSLK